MTLRRGEQTIEQVPFDLAPGASRVIRIDRLFLASASGGVISFRSSQRVVMYGYAGEAITPAAATTSKRRSVRSGTPAPVLVPHTIVLRPSKDNTLFEANDGSLSNGAGPHLFIGNTASRQKRRALVAFDVASQIPPGSQVTRVTLKLTVSLGNFGAQAFRLHRLIADWGEGASFAGESRDGGGAGSKSGDATWAHRFFPNQRWTTIGGDFEAAADATTPGSISDLTWESAAMITRVQQWIDQPSTNFGWIAIGDEANSRTAKRLQSRELSEEEQRPALTIEYNGRP